ncbi:hypothetical protein SAMN05443574_12212 [Haloarcula vallismortis]|uniref:DUF7260 domain-containing protein n=2 Tax=Haloarcula vallismortis TaxID=28442 RepID=M0JTC3_HALVA|nr:hypothetical protein [Haloarcula vallismortis]EMA11214.1 hypothetical protein C437_01982 [Haloarcula vallismortis ATCC 29715]SDX25319.1 hypothetical protein SAMN05443574_12212 [Haloarcula vallismortis]
MATTPAQDGAQWFLHTWRDYILEPVETALTVLDEEHTELAAEQAGLEEFLQRLRAVDPVERPSAPVGTRGRQSASDPVETLRDAYTDTVLAVDHYESVYDESLVENVAIEFGQDYAALFHPEANVGFSPPLKRSLVAAAEQAIDERVSLDRAVKIEQESIQEHHGSLQEIIDTLDSTVVPEWYRETFQSDVTALLRKRQDQLHSSVHRFETHEFCTYMYDDQLWTYPVLTSLARLQESVDS